MDPHRDDATVAAAYDTIAEDYADRFLTTEPELPIDLAMIGHFAALLPGERQVLDAGCGAGRMMPLLARLGCDVRGVDLSPGMIRRAQKDHPTFGTTVSSLTDLPFPGASFDGVFCWYSTIHSTVDDLGRIITEAHRVLRPDGLILTAFHVGDDVVDLAEVYRRYGHDVALHRYDRRPDDVAAELAASRFREVARMERSASPHESMRQAVIFAERTDGRAQ